MGEATGKVTNHPLGITATQRRKLVMIGRFWGQEALKRKGEPPSLPLRTVSPCPLSVVPSLLPPCRGPACPFTLQQVGSLPRERPSTQGALSLGEWMAAPFRCWTRFLCKGRGTVPSTPQSKEQTTWQKRKSDRGPEWPNARGGTCGSAFHLNP